MKASGFRKPLIIAVVLVLFGFSAASTAASEESEKPVFAQGSIKGPRPQETEFKPFAPASPGEEIPDWLARWELAKVLSHAKRYDESILQYQKLLREKPGLSEARIEMANVFYWKGDKAKALEILEKLPPKDVDKDGRLLMADIYVADKAYEKAEQIYRAHVKEHPDDLTVQLKLADMLSWAGKYDESLRAYENILEKRPDDTQVRRRYAFVLIWAGRHEDAAGELKKTLD